MSGLRVPGVGAGARFLRACGRGCVVWARCAPLVRVAWINGRGGRGNLLVLVPSPSLFLLLWGG